MLLTKYCADDRGNGNEMGRRLTRTSIGWGNVKEGDHLEDMGVRGRIILKQILNNYDGRTLTMRLAEDSHKWRAEVNTVI